MNSLHIMFIPFDAQQPSCRHPHHGHYHTTWCYSPRSQHFTITSVLMLFAVRRVRLYVTTAGSIEKTHSDGALVAHTAKSSHIMGARAGYAMFPYEPTNVAWGPPHPSRFHSYKHLIALRVSMSIVWVHLSSCTLVSTNLA